VEKEEKKYYSPEDEVREVKPRIQVKQMEGLGALKMYAGRKRMFKGHKWERVQAQRKKRTQILMRDMNKRIVRYKEWYLRRKPNPLRPPRGTKVPKLPF